MRLYASTYPGEVAGLVSVDATSEWLRELLTPAQWSFLARGTLEPALPGAETVDLNASLDEMLRAKAAHPVAADDAAGSALCRPSARGATPDFLDPANLQRVQQRAQDKLRDHVPYARHIVARKSGHFIQVAQPRLVTNSGPERAERGATGRGALSGRRQPMSRAGESRRWCER